jgi:hypothetical protein
MKGLLLIVAILMSATAAMGDKIFRQDFEGAQFPPNSWHTRGDWVRKNAGGNHYAYGWVKVKGLAYGTTLYSRQFWGRYNWSLMITFRYAAWKTGDLWTDTANVSVSGAYGEEYRKELRYSRDWRRCTFLTPELGRGKFYELSFHTGGSSPEGKVGALYYKVDDVRLAYCLAPVNPTSLGRVKAVFR